MSSSKVVGDSAAEHHRESAELLASAIKSSLPENTGFALFIVDTGQKDGSLSYISNLDRDEMVATLKDFIAAAEGRSFDPPTTKM